MNPDHSRDKKIEVSENDRWILSFYRTSEISGALFFGRIAKSLKAGPVQQDMTKHFADESQHAWYWTECLKNVGMEPIKLDAAYQDQYVAAAGMPANIMEILAITQVFEKRVIGQYALHLTAPEVHPEIQRTLRKIMEDEKWHIQWVDAALKAMGPEYGESHIQETLKRYWAADQEVYKKSLSEHQDRLSGLLKNRVKVG
jgi:1,2-phenylacetyl-CoA epoxidase catalytic subunit